MTAPLAHFAINADDVDVSRSFYERVFGWEFHPFGPPGFFQIDTGGDAPVRGAMQQRRDLLDGAPTNGLECTFAVDDVDAVVAAVEAAGGTILMAKTTITGVGDLVFFRDPAGNAVGAMQYVDQPTG